MDNRIVISQGETTITMPLVKAITVGGKEVCKEKTMASGKVVKEMLGHRVTITAQWDWLPADLLAELAGLLRGGGFFSVRYPDPAAGASSGMFSISFPAMGVFAFLDGRAVWHNVSLTMTGQEVV